MQNKENPLISASDNHKGLRNVTANPPRSNQREVEGFSCTINASSFTAHAGKRIKSMKLYALLPFAAFLGGSLMIGCEKRLQQATPPPPTVSVVQPVHMPPICQSGGA